MVTLTCVTLAAVVLFYGSGSFAAGCVAGVLVLVGAFSAFGGRSDDE